MNRWKLIGLLWVAGFLRLGAQVTVDLELLQEQFLPNEEIRVEVRIKNFSGQTLQFGADADWLKFAVEASDGFVPERFREVPVQGWFEVESGKIGVRRIDISPHFSLSRPGRYLVQATVRVDGLGTSISSKPTRFDIVAGTKLWEQAVGIPRKGEQTNAPVEVRKFALQQAIYLKEMRLYLRMTDVTESVVYRVFPLGPMVSFSRPEVQVDRMSRLHVLYQTGAKAYLYAVVGPEGDLQVRQTHVITRTRPALRVNRKGELVVEGGARRVTLADLPGRTELAPTNAPTDAPAGEAGSAPGKK